MLETLEKKLSCLEEIIRGYGSVALAFSGGKDSSLLLKICIDVLGRDSVLAVTAVSPIRRPEELQTARDLARSLNARHALVHMREYKNPEFIESANRRCFICKEELFGEMERLAEEGGYAHLVDGTNLDDAEERRPTFAVARKYGVRWPLVDADIGASDVEALLRRLGLGGLVRPHYSCSAWDIDLRNLA